MCESQGNYEEAAEAFEKVIDLSKVQLVNHNISETGEASLFNLGHCYRKLQRLDDAIEMYKRALRCSPNKASTYTALAFTYHLMSDYDSAINYYHKVRFEKKESHIKPNSILAPSSQILGLPLAPSSHLSAHFVLTLQMLTLDQQALGLSPDDTLTTEMLERALKNAVCD